jgi:glycosyltransferase involved in cell wall biosynthesis
MVEHLGISNRIRFVGDRADVPDLLAASDIFCQPNLGPEGFGITFVEAMAAGLPVVTSGIGGALEIVDETCGILVPPGDRTALAAALIRLVGDRGKRHQLGLGGRARARALCDPAVQMRHIAELMDGVCRETSGAANAPGTLAW